jgi:hypothetical protein
MLFPKPLSWSEAMKRREFGAIADWFIYYFFWGGIIGLLVAGFAAAFDASGGFWASLAAGFRIFVLSSLFAAASTLSGWLLGLLFGIPRTLARANLPPPATGASGGGAGASSAAAPSSRVNTNLEDISDWLTKTIVGVGLTQLFYVPHYLWQRPMHERPVDLDLVYKTRTKL